MDWVRPAWVTRYLVVDTGSWLASRKVLVSPIAMTQPDWEAKSRLAYQHANALVQARSCEDDDPKLRSCNEEMGYHIHARDGDIGHVQGLLVDERTWAILYLVVDTSKKSSGF